MALFNYATKEITLKIVYYGPGLSGKTTNLQHLHTVLNPETKGKLLSLSTESDRTLFFDFLPIELGKIRDFSIRFQLYTVPGQVRYNATRKVVLKGADAVVFVADSQKAMRDQNLESFENMRENLVSNNIDPDTVPIILQYNKRDLQNILSVEELNQDLNPGAQHEILEATAINGGGVEEAFKRITKLVLKDISKKHKIEIQPAEQKKEAAIPAKEATLEQMRKEIRPEQEEFEIPVPVPAVEPVIAEADTIEVAEEALEILPENEAEAIEAIPQPEPVEPAYEPELMSGSGHAAVEETKTETPAPEPSYEEAAPAAPVTPWTEILPEPPIMERAVPPSSVTPPAARIVPEPPLPEKTAPAAPATPWTELIREAPTAEEIAPVAPVVPPLAKIVPEVPIPEEMPRREERPAPVLQPFPVEKIDGLADDLAAVSDTLKKITDSLSLLQRTVADLKGEVLSIKNEIALSKEAPAKEPELKDVKELRELKREQKEMSDLIKDVLDLLGSLQEKKSWFKL